MKSFVVVPISLVSTIFYTNSNFSVYSVFLFYKQIKLYTDPKKKKKDYKRSLFVFW